MVETYSLAITGAMAENQQQPQTAIDIGDSVARAPGDQQSAMMLRTPFLAQMPDGSQQWCVYDETRSRPGGPLYLLKLY